MEFALAQPLLVALIFGMLDIDLHRRGRIDLGGHPHKVHLTPLHPSEDPDGTYQNIVLYQAPGNTTQIEYGDKTTACKKLGSGNATSCQVSHKEGGFAGGIYVPDATSKLRGTVTMCATGPIVADQIYQEGSSLMFADATTFVSTTIAEPELRLTQ